ncbi:MAG: hypothetical protein JXA11_14410 [Phycisphaerae bacterium]|nr:hypothetical protein [Phycisphaerae bacterium]
MYDRLEGFFLVFLLILLLPAWRGVFGESGLGTGALLAGATLPAALGFLLALRCGVVDLSVWAVTGAGGVLAAGVVNAFDVGGMVPWFVLPAACGLAVVFGALIGGVNALLARRFRRWSFFATGLVGLAVLGGTRWICPLSRLVVSDSALDSWVSGLTAVLVGWMGDGEIPLDGPLVILRMLVVFVSWTCVLLVLMGYDSAARRRPRLREKRLARPVSLCASGALAGVAGVCRMIDLGQAPVPTRWIDGLSIPVAAILAGAVLLRGTGRTMLAVILLPPALLLSDAWEMTVWPISVHGYSVSLAMLGALVLMGQLGFRAGYKHAERGRWFARIASLLSGMGVILLGLTAWFHPTVQRMLIVASLVAGGTGLALLILVMQLQRRRHPARE